MKTDKRLPFKAKGPHTVEPALVRGKWMWTEQRCVSCRRVAHHLPGARECVCGGRMVTHSASKGLR